jgi:hypothetical protein
MGLGRYRVGLPAYRPEHNSSNISLSRLLAGAPQALSWPHWVLCPSPVYPRRLPNFAGIGQTGANRFVRSP